MRPPESEVAILIAEGHSDVARERMRSAMRAAGGTIKGAAPLLKMSLRTAFRYAQRLGIVSMYDGPRSVGGARPSRKKFVDIGE